MVEFVFEKFYQKTNKAMYVPISFAIVQGMNILKTHSKIQQSSLSSPPDFEYVYP
jgi:hypothetical protein